MFIQFAFHIPLVTDGVQTFRLTPASIHAPHLEVGTGIIPDSPCGPLLRFSALLSTHNRLLTVTYQAFNQMLKAMYSPALSSTLDGERELIWSRDGIRYRYGFHVQKGIILAEWLYYKRKRETYIFYKHEDVFEINQGYPDLIELVKRHLAGPKHFLLGTAATLFPTGMRDILPHDFIHCLERISVYGSLHKYISHEAFVDLNNFLQQTDPSFETMKWHSSSRSSGDLTFKWKHQREVTFQELPSGIRDEMTILLELFQAFHRYSVIFLHGFWDLFHPLVQKNLLARFNDPQQNPLGSQLIVTTLNPYSISHEVSRQDQLWLLHPTAKGAFQLSSFCDFRGNGKIWRSGRFPDYYLHAKTGFVPLVD